MNELRQAVLYTAWHYWDQVSPYGPAIFIILLLLAVIIVVAIYFARRG